VSTIAAERARAFERHGDRRGLGAAAAFGFSVLSVLFAAYVVVAACSQSRWRMVDIRQQVAVGRFRDHCQRLCFARAIADRQDRG